MSMSSKNDEKEEIPIKCSEETANKTACINDEDDIVFQFKIIISIVFIILILFLAFFVYNLIKCYLPKWRRERQLREEVERKVEIKNSSPEKPEIELA